MLVSLNLCLYGLFSKSFILPPLPKAGVATLKHMCYKWPGQPLCAAHSISERGQWQVGQEAEIKAADQTRSTGQGKQSTGAKWVGKEIRVALEVCRTHLCHWPKQFAPAGHFLGQWDIINMEQGIKMTLSLLKILHGRGGMIHFGDPALRTFYPVIPSF